MKKAFGKVCAFGVLALAATGMTSADAGESAGAAFSWPEPTREMKPWVYNWWMGSAVDKEGLEHQCRELVDKGFGGFHVIPIYGAKGYEKQYRRFLSDEWFEAWNMAARMARRHGLDVDLTMGSGWCFGGPWVTVKDAASSRFKVKRAGPGGTGYMIDPFSASAMSNHVAQFDAAFRLGGTAERPRAFYHDSFEYFRAVPKKGQDIDESLLACFRVWTDWCKKNGYITRNEAHGAPANWLDFYAIADIPETEMFAKVDRDILVSKFASSAAHVKGTTLVSAESCTWVDDHFREQPREIKLFLDRLFLSGVNHVFYHGFCYSPVDVVWPGWCFYASLQMNPRNPIWREMAAFNAYVTRCQSVFQTWTPDNDLAVLWDPEPFRAKYRRKPFDMSVHNRRSWFYGQPIGKVAREFYDAGYSFDYVSPRMVKAGAAKKYAAYVDPAVYLKANGEKRAALVKNARKMPFSAADGILATRWKKNGETGYFVVNTGTVARVISSARSFTSADPLTGAIAQTRSVRLEPLHSRFIVGGDFRAGPAGAVPAAQPLATASWQVKALCGGPVLPAPRTLEKPVGWNTFDEAFSGTMVYTTRFDRPTSDYSLRPLVLDLGRVHEIARVRLNGVDLGVRFLAPYSFEVPKRLVKAEGNVLEVEVTNLGANRLRWNDVNKVRWKYFHDANMLNIKYRKLDASKWKPLDSGLFGPVTLGMSNAPVSPSRRGGS